MNKRKAIAAIVLSLYVPLLSMAEADLTIEYSKCYLKYNTMNGETEIILYNTEPSLETKVTKEKFQDVFKLTEFKIKELIFSEPGTKSTSIRVIAQTTNFMSNTPVQQLFSNMLNTKAEVHLGDDGSMGTKMSVMITMQENMHLADKTARVISKAIYWSTDETTLVLEFDLSDFPSKPLEVTFEWKKTPTPGSNPTREDRRRRTA